MGTTPDIVLLRATDPPDGLTELQVARDWAYETGQASALARLPTRKTDHEIPGVIGNHIDEKGRRAFGQPVATGYWLEKGSSGSPMFIGSGQQLAGLVSMAELGDEPQNAPVREAYVVPGTIIWPFVKKVAQREFDERQRAIQQKLTAESQAAGARELIFEIARRSGGDPAANFDQAMANASAAYEEGLKAIEAGARGGNLGALVDDLLKKIAERTPAWRFLRRCRRGRSRFRRMGKHRGASGGRRRSRRGSAFSPRARGRTFCAATFAPLPSASRASSNWKSQTPRVVSRRCAESKTNILSRGATRASTRRLKLRSNSRALR